MLSILTVILLLIVFLVLLVLFAAIDVVFDMKGSGVSVEHTVVVHWLLFSRQVSPEPEDEVNDEHSNDDFPEEFKDAEKYVTEKVKGHFQESGEKEKTKKKKSIDMTYSEMIQTFRQLRAPVIRFIKGLVCAIKIPDARVNAVYGFPDPSYTGIACGYSHALMAYLKCNFKNLRMNLEPDFVESKIEFDMSGKLRIRLYRFIPVILKFVFNMSVLRFSWSFFIKKYYRKSSGNL
ncbi:Protein of unknown function [Methanolobus vulcani]|jgi:macrodomain Ter protein organizer (MatP/YcbG family)|uniref:DUF2953 domain-containing protein n=1 Tax=Methanolobus vulcani TaxID=38026 RepID=A0A7Z7FDG1_9EURY|nr:DUF2953 domain-containing protein [Methanolobus vulcani]SDF44383.1 Protein of unknown function [Methanolobus vulcani]